jgi:hypothetical protein
MKILSKRSKKLFTDMAKVEDKVTRSKNLLDNLSSEKTRW